MDTFMDKLAQKLTAQEMIKANLAADAEEMSRLRETEKEYKECLEQMQKLMNAGMTEIENTETQLSEEVLDKLEELKAALAEKPELQEELKKLLEEKLESVNDNVHKECVKVYRNVQAVVVEENAKQTDNLANTVNALRGKLNGILGVSIVSLILAIAGIVLQVLNMMNFKFF